MALHSAIWGDEMIQEQKLDQFWLYIGLAVCTLVVGIVLVKQSESGKYDSIQKQADEELVQMNIRVLE